MSEAFAPIVLFVYSRLDHTKKTVEALNKNSLAKKTNLFIFSDGPKRQSDKKDVEKVRNYLKKINGFKSVKIFESKKNKGLANSIIFGVTKIVNKYGKVIVVEDDILTSKYFLEFMNNSLNFYKNNSKVISVSGYVYPIKNLPENFFLKKTECWGWATWKRGWDLFEKDGSKLLKQIEEKNLLKEFDFENSYDYSKMLKDQIAGKNSSWAIRWYASAFLNNKLTFYSGKTLTQNIGVDGTGTHGGRVNVYNSKLSDKSIKIVDIPIQEDLIVRKKFTNYFKKIHFRIFKVYILIKSSICGLIGFQ